MYRNAALRSRSRTEPSVLAKEGKNHTARCCLYIEIKLLKAGEAVKNTMQYKFLAGAGAEFFSLLGVLLKKIS